MPSSLRRRFTAVGLVVLLRAANAYAVESVFESHPASGPRNLRAIGRSRELLQQVLTLYPGATVAVGLEGEIVWSAGFGYANVPKEIPVSTRTMFRIGQVAESLTAALAVRLAEGGRLDLDAVVEKSIPAFPIKVFPVTARQVAGHLAGLRPASKGDPAGQKPCSGPQDALSSFIHQPLVRVPGTAFLYSSHGYVLLSAVIASACGQEYSTCLEEKVLRPAGMNATVREGAGGRHPSASEFYERMLFGVLRQARPVDTSCAFGRGGYLSTAEDLVRFGMALLGGELVSSEHLPEILSPQKTVSGASTGHGLGWRITVDSRGRRLSQSGRTIGGRSAIILVPERRLVVTLLANIDGAHLDDHANRIAGFFLEPE